MPNSIAFFVIYRTASQLSVASLIISPTMRFSIERDNGIQILQIEAVLKVKATFFYLFFSPKITILAAAKKNL